MKWLRFILWGLAAGLVLLFLFTQTQSVDIEQHHRTELELRRLKQLNVALNEEILKIRFSLLTTYDQLNRILNDTNEVTENMRYIAVGVLQQGNVMFNQDYELYEQLIKEKEMLLDDFKSENAKLNNSLQYFPSATIRAREIMGTIEGEDLIKADIRKLFEEILIYSLSDEESSKTRIQGLIDELRDAGEKLAPEKKTFLLGALSHAQIIISKKSEVNSILADLLNMPVSQRIDDMINSYNVFFDRELESAKMYRAFLLLFSLFLLAGIFMVLFRLRKTASALAVSNTDLRKMYADLQTTHKKLVATQDQLFQSEKLKVVGRLASGVAHEVKNPLAIMLQGIEYITKKIPKDNAQVNEVLRDIVNAVHRTDNVIKGMLDFSRLSKLAIEPKNINGIIEASIHLVKHEFDQHQISVVKELDSELPMVKVDGNKMEQVFVNIILNAIQAMLKGGKLTVRTYKRMMTKDDLGVGQREEDPFAVGDTVVFTEITDTGTGIPAEIMGKIWEPFFTTKGGSGGTGLGLSIIKNIVEMHNGRIFIENEPQGGVKTTVMLKA